MGKLYVGNVLRGTVGQLKIGNTNVLKGYVGNILVFPQPTSTTTTTTTTTTTSTTTTTTTAPPTTTSTTTTTTTITPGTTTTTTAAPATTTTTAPVYSISSTSDTNACNGVPGCDNFKVTFTGTATLCLCTGFTVLSISRACFDTEVGNNETFWMSDGNNVRQFIRQGTTFDVLSAGSCTSCGFLV